MRFFIKFDLVLMGFILFLSCEHLFSQTITLRHTPGYCNRVTASVNGYTSVNLYYITQAAMCGNISRPLAGGAIPNFTYQLQKLVNGSWVNEGALRHEFLPTFTYRDLVFGQTYRVVVRLRYPSIPLYSYLNPCGQSIGFAYDDPNGGFNVVSNAMQIVQQFTNANISGIILDGGMQNTGGNGATLATRKKYCLTAAIAAEDVFLDISNTFGANHWVINLTRTNLEGGWAPGEWHDYELPSDVSPVGIFSEGWFNTYGSNALWPGLYKVSIMGWNDCLNTPWAINEDFFELLPPGQGPCRLDIRDEELDFTLYPNPVSQGYIEYYTTGRWENSGVDYSIVTQNGQIQSTGRIIDNSGYIDVSSLQSGLYFIRFQSEQGIVTKRVSIVK